MFRAPDIFGPRCRQARCEPRRAGRRGHPTIRYISLWIRPPTGPQRACPFDEAGAGPLPREHPFGEARLRPSALSPSPRPQPQPPTEAVQRGVGKAGAQAVGPLLPATSLALVHVLEEVVRGQLLPRSRLS